MDISLLQFTAQYGGVGVMVGIVLWREWQLNTKLWSLLEKQQEINGGTITAIIELRNVLEIIKEKIK